MKLYALVLLLIGAKLSFCIKIIPTDEDPGEPLILTPLLKENKIQEAQDASRVNNTKFGPVDSFAGYFTVDELYDSNLFFWFFPAFEDYENAPVLVWLEGGPGATAMYGLFQENGPFIIKSSTEIEFSETTWAKNHSIIYIDNPAGTGFSFTNGGYFLNQTKVADSLYNALQQFFTMFPNLRKNEFFITGESYGGKYVPSLGYKILKSNEEVELEKKINLKGLTIENGLSDPKYQLLYGDRLYQLGLIDSNQREVFKSYEEEFVLAIENEDWDSAYNLTLLIFFDRQTSLFRNITGFENLYNLLLEVDRAGATSDKNLYEFLAIPEIRKSIHAGNVTFDDPIAKQLLQKDIPKSVAPWVSELLSNVRVLIYNGQLDIIVPYTQTIEYLQHLNFSSAEEYKVAERHKWYVGEELAGYVKSAGNLTEVLVRNAGHMVTTDQPVWTLDLITKFIRNQTLYNDN